MSPIILVGPAVEPVTLPDAKAHLRLDRDDEDELVEALILAARVTVERATRLGLVEQTWRISLDAWPSDRAVPIALAPLIGVDEVRIVAEAGPDTVLDPSTYRLVGAPDRAELLIDDAAPAPIRKRRAIEIDCRIGFGAGPASVPEPLRLAVRQLVAHWFEHRGDDAARAPVGLPADIRALLAPFVRPRLA